MYCDCMVGSSNHIKGLLFILVLGQKPRNPNTILSGDISGERFAGGKCPGGTGADVRGGGGG